MATGIETGLAAMATKIALSIATAVASFALGRLWLGVLQPWIQSIWWSGMKLAPSYKGEFKYLGTGPVLHDHVELKQKAKRVWGTMTVADGRWGKYEFTATLDDGILRGTWDSAGENSHGRGSFLLATQPGSSELKGWCMEPADGVVLAYEYKWCTRS